MSKYEVEFTATYKVTIVVDDDEDDIEDAIADIDIPEGGLDSAVYQKDTFVVRQVEKIKES